MNRTASCSCGQLALTVRGEPKMQGLCHCFECQKITGSNFLHHGYWERASVQEITGKSTAWRRASATGRWVENHFCPVCGSTLFSYAEFDPDSICISIGNFEDPSFPPPQYSVWERHKHPWVHVPDTCQAMDMQG